MKVLGIKVQRHAAVGKAALVGKGRALSAGIRGRARQRQRQRAESDDYPFHNISFSVCVLPSLLTTQLAREGNKQN